MYTDLRFVKKCQFIENNDKNGVVYWIGTRGGTSSWVNPGAKSWIRCDASSLMRDSEPAHALCGRISVRCVTQPVENSWFSVDLKNIYVSPTHYSLRHYISWDTEALRNWVLEGSFEGHGWVTLRAHKDDASLNHKGAVATWELRSKGARYRVFRIRQTGVNSNNHLYNSLSGFEIYGDVFQIGYPQPRQADTKTLAKLGETEKQQALQFDCSLTGEVPWDNKDDSQPQTQTQQTPGQMSVADEDQDMAMLRELARQEKQRLIHHLSGGNGYSFYYSKDFDENGILHFLATDWRTALWRNPAETGVVTVTSSRLAKDSVPATTICGREVKRCVCMAEKNNWFIVDFRTIYIRITHYSLRHYDSWDTECLRNWYLEGSNDLSKFKIIHTHTNDTGLNGKGSTHTWQVDSKEKRYRAFRIRQYEKNSNSHWVMIYISFLFFF
ncbi:hypothetical protein RFI_01124 [Reticulomyxa filosa]|uniref:F5/8 type C domain-containing protein n=1 Tax=Reticulomyxa filosa TaxID=46433 RepID=X6PCW9_RETFI|nr:hypothetical protein RFI_01124 [Reticulomyxa filosa]|eukprot:ETO35938.1 hypothetical protein RFI_01124 [Reticulomyxa filosa]